LQFSKLFPILAVVYRCFLKKRAKNVQKWRPSPPS
jgi:hypothetical protein